MHLIGIPEWNPFTRWVEWTCVFSVSQRTWISVCSYITGTGTGTGMLIDTIPRKWRHYSSLSMLNIPSHSQKCELKCMFRVVNTKMQILQSPIRLRRASRRRIAPVPQSLSQSTQEGILFHTLINIYGNFRRYKWINVISFQFFFAAAATAKPMKSFGTLWN